MKEPFRLTGKLRDLTLSEFKKFRIVYKNKEDLEIGISDLGFFRVGVEDQ